METKQQQTFEEYLKTNWERGVIDFRVCCYNDGSYFYIHPLNKDGETPNYRAQGNSLILDNGSEYGSQYGISS